MQTSNRYDITFSVEVDEGSIGIAQLASEATKHFYFDSLGVAITNIYVSKSDY